MKTITDANAVCMFGDRWIPVSEQRPPVDVRVWFFTYTGCRYIGRLNEDGSTVVDYPITPGPQGIAKMWQPLPKPPEEATKDTIKLKITAPEDLVEILVIGGDRNGEVVRVRRDQPDVVFPKDSRSSPYGWEIDRYVIRTFSFEINGYRQYIDAFVQENISIERATQIMNDRLGMFPRGETPIEMRRQ